MTRMLRVISESHCLLIPVHIDITRVFNNVLLQQTQLQDSNGEKTITAHYNSWYDNCMPVIYIHRYCYVKMKVGAIFSQVTLIAFLIVTIGIQKSCCVASVLGTLSSPRTSVPLSLSLLREPSHLLLKNSQT